MIRTVIIFLLAIATAYGQTNPDTGKPETEPYRNEASDPAFQKNRTLFKAGASLPILRQSSFTGYYAAIALEATAEQKIYKGLTVLAGLDNTFGLALDGRNTKFYSLEMPVALRYYFSLTRQQKQRADRHSFFSPYVAIQTHNVLFSQVAFAGLGLSDLERYHQGNVLPYRTPHPVRLDTRWNRAGDRFDLLQYAFLQLGSQHQVLKKRGYLDVNVLVPIPGLIHNKRDYTLSTPSIVNVKLGVYLARPVAGNGPIR
ncbi:hypothetical protein GCM10027299_12510 [Larkinella ripae]